MNGSFSHNDLSPDNIILVDPDEYDCQFVIHGARQDIAYHPDETSLFSVQGLFVESPRWSD